MNADNLRIMFLTKREKKKILEIISISIFYTNDPTTQTGKAFGIFGTQKHD